MFRCRACPLEKCNAHTNTHKNKQNKPYKHTQKQTKQTIQTHTKTNKNKNKQKQKQSKTMKSKVTKQIKISVDTHNAFRRTYVQNATNMMKMISFHTYRDG